MKNVALLLLVCILYGTSLDSEEPSSDTTEGMTEGLTDEE